MSFTGGVLVPYMRIGNNTLNSELRYYRLCVCERERKREKGEGEGGEIDHIRRKIKVQNALVARQAGNSRTEQFLQTIPC